MNFYAYNDDDIQRLVSKAVELARDTSEPVDDVLDRCMVELGHPDHDGLAHAHIAVPREGITLAVIGPAYNGMLVGPGVSMSSITLESDIEAVQEMAVILFGQVRNFYATLPRRQ